MKIAKISSIILVLSLVGVVVAGCSKNLVWIPINLATNRVTFVFYFLSTKPAICIGLAMAISDWLDYLKKRYRCLQGFASEENQYSHPDVDRT